MYTTGKNKAGSPSRGVNTGKKNFQIPVMPIGALLKKTSLLIITVPIPAAS